MSSSSLDSHASVLPRMIRYVSVVVPPFVVNEAAAPTSLESIVKRGFSRRIARYERGREGGRERHR